MTLKSLPSQEELQREFIYKEDGSLWSKTKFRLKLRGCIMPCGYISIRHNNVTYYAHRLIWVYHNGLLPEGLEIDHINRTRTDNRIENLRLVTSTENKRNRSLPSNSTTGIKGVYWLPGKKKWLAAIKTDGKLRALKYTADFHEAVAARRTAEEHYGFTKI